MDKKKSNILMKYIVFCILATIVAAAAVVGLGGRLNFHLIMLIFLIVVILTLPIEAIRIFIIYQKLDKNLKVLQPILEDRCDPIKYLEKVQRLLQKEDCHVYLKHNKFLNSQFEIALSGGYYYSNDNQKAAETCLNILSVISEGVNKKQQFVIKYVVYTALVGIYMKDNDISAARGYYEKIKKIRAKVSTWKMTTKTIFILSLMDDSIKMLDALFLSAEGKYTEALTYYLQAWKKEDNTQLTKVVVQSNLAGTYEHLGDEDKCKACLSYVVEHGGSTFMARNAREKLVIQNKIMKVVTQP